MVIAIILHGMLNHPTWIVESFESFERKPFKAPKRDIEQYNERFQEILGLR